MEIGSHDSGRMPDYTDPDDRTRLRLVTSNRGWSADRDDPDPVRLAALYRRMDQCVKDLAASASPSEVHGVAVDMAATWVDIRRMQREQG